MKYGFTYTIRRGRKKIRTEAKPEFKTKSAARKWINENRWLKGTNPRIIKFK